MLANFGIGNGKTLICAALAAFYALTENNPVIILGKSEHLVLRDEKNFE